METFNEDKAREQVKSAMQKVIDTQAEWFKTIEELRAVAKEWPDVDPMIPKYNDLSDEDKKTFQAVMGMRQSIDGGITYCLRQALVRYGNLLFI